MRVAGSSHKALPPACLTRIPDGEDLLGFRNSPALGLSPLGLGRSFGCGSLASLRSAVLSHDRIMPGER